MMPVFKTAVRLVFRYPVYMLVYIVMMGLLGYVVTGVTSTSPTGTVSFTAPELSIAVIDRDSSPVSDGVEGFLAERYNLVELADEPRELQDAIAQNRVPYILIIPEGYGGRFQAAVSEGRELPELESIYSVEAVTGSLVDIEVAGFLNALRVIALSDSADTLSAQISRAQETALLEVPVTVVQSSESISRANLLPFYFKWSAYPMTSGIGILTALTFSSFQSGELKRRSGSSPLSTLAQNSQIALASLVTVLLTWMFICLLSLSPVIGGLELIAANPVAFALIALAGLIHAVMSLTVGFLISQFQLDEMATNGFVNIISLVMMFLSGIMMGGSSYLKGVMLVIGRFIPCFWYSEAINAVAVASSFNLSALSHYFMSLGMVLLFTLAFFSLALLVGRLRMQTADAGGNTAAASSSGL